MPHALVTNRQSRRPAVLLTVVLAAVALVATALATVQSTAAAAAPEPYGLWEADQAPEDATDSETRDVTLGTIFSADRPGLVTGVQFYRAEPNRGPHTVYLERRGGQRLATADVDPSGGPGWVVAEFDEPVLIDAKEYYVASYRAPNGRYSARVGALSWDDPLINGSLTAWRGQYRYAGESTQGGWRDSLYYVGPLFSSVGSSATPTTEEPTAPSSPTPSSPPVDEPTVPAEPETTTPTTPDDARPGAGNTGIPAGVTLSDYSGPMTITRAGTVIDAARIQGRVVIAAPDVVISRSRITGRVDADDSSASVQVVDSEIDAGSSSAPGIGYRNVTVLRTEIVGGQHSVLCGTNCVVEDSWLHDQALPAGADWHNNAYLSNGGSNVRIVHNTLSCTPRNNSADGGCTSDLSLFGDFAPIRDVLISDNYFTATPGGYCATFGYNASKPYGTQVSGVVVTGNVFERGSGRCAYYGPVTSYSSSGGGVWSGNTWSDGGAVEASR